MVSQSWAFPPFGSPARAATACLGIIYVELECCKVVFLLLVFGSVVVGLRGKIFPWGLLWGGVGG